MEFERDWSFSLDAIGLLGDGEKKNYFSRSGIFPGKAGSVIMLGFEYAINPQRLIEILGAIFEKIKILFFSYVNYP